MCVALSLTCMLLQGGYRGGTSTNGAWRDETSGPGKRHVSTCTAVASAGDTATHMSARLTCSMTVTVFDWQFQTVPHGGICAAVPLGELPSGAVRASRGEPCEHSTVPTTQHVHECYANPSANRSRWYPWRQSSFASSCVSRTSINEPWTFTKTSLPGCQPVRWKTVGRGWVGTVHSPQHHSLLPGLLLICRRHSAQVVK